MLIYVLFAVNQLVLHHLLQIGSFVAQLRHMVNHLLHQMVPIKIVLHPHVKGRRYRALFLVTSDVEAAIRV